MSWVIRAVFLLSALLIGSEGSGSDVDAGLSGRESPAPAPKGNVWCLDNAGSGRAGFVTGRDGFVTGRDVDEGMGRDEDAGSGQIGRAHV